MKVKEFPDGPVTEEHYIDSIDGVRTSAGPIAMMACAVFIVFGVLLHFEAVPHPPTLAGVTALIPIGVLFLLRVDALKTLTISIPPMLLMVWIFLSSSWTEDPERTAFLIRLQLPLLLGFMIVGAVLSDRDVMKWLLRAGQFVLFISVVATVAIPSTREGALLNGEVLEGWHALFPHKNDFGPFLAIFMGVVIVADQNRWTRWPTLLLSSIMLIGSQSITGITAAMVAFAALAWLRANRRNDDRVMSIAIVITSAIALAGAFGARAGLPIFLEATGKDPTFSGRTDIWSAVWGAVVDRPILGYGRGGLFFNPPNDISVDLWRQIGFRAPHAHNGALDLVSQIGVVGLLIFAALFFSTFRSALHSYRRDEQFGEFALVFLATLAVASLSEPVFLGPYTSLLAMLRIVSIRLDRVAALNELSDQATPRPISGRDIPQIGKAA